MPSIWVPPPVRASWPGGAAGVTVPGDAGTAKSEVLERLTASTVAPPPRALTPRVEFSVLMAWFTGSGVVPAGNRPESGLLEPFRALTIVVRAAGGVTAACRAVSEIGRASCRERVFGYV